MRVEKKVIKYPKEFKTIIPHWKCIAPVFTVVVKPGTSLDDKLDPLTHGATKSTLVHSCNELVKATKLFCPVLKNVLDDY